MVDQKLSELSEVTGGPVSTDEVYFIRSDGGSPPVFTSYRAEIGDLPAASTTGLSSTEYTYNATTTAPPGTGTLRINNATQASVTTIWVHDTNAVGVDVSTVVHMLVTGNRLLIQDKTNAANYQFYDVSGAITDSGAYTTIPVTWISGGSSFTAGRVMLAVFGLGATATPFELQVAASDETTSLTTGTAKLTFYAPMDATITEVFIGVTGQSSSGVVTADLNKNGSTMFSTPPSIDASENTSLTGTAAVLSTTTWTKGDKMTIDIDAAGTSAEGLKMIIRGTRL